MLGGIILMHLFATLIPEFLGENVLAKRITVWGLSILNAILHFVVIGYALIKGATPEELFLVVMISSAVAMSAIGIREKISRGKK